MLVVAAVLAGLLVLVGVGRWEGRRHERDEVRRIAAVRAAIGPLGSPMPERFRVFATFACLIYPRAGNPYALEICVDKDGRVIESYDRRGGETRIASVRERPAASTVRVDPGEVERILRRLGAFS
ncbi:MAG: hypothetical protein QOE69_479 [Thermoleophilaceae bacterium]|nr:hypothetical protein [Thermoleophilaceae bacterium]